MSIFFALASGGASFYDQIKEIAYPVAFFIFFVMQKLDSMRAAARDKAAADAREELALKMEEQKQAAAAAARLVAEKLEAQNLETARAAQEVKDQLDKATVAQQIKMEEIHVDVNSKMGNQKKKTWDFALALAQRPDATPEDMANARGAEKDYLDHMEAQARADERVRMVREAAIKSGLALPAPTSG